MQNIGYVIAFESPYSNPIIRTQVIEILVKVQELRGKEDGFLYVLNFEHILKILLHYKKYKALKEELHLQNIKLITLPILTLPKIMDWFYMKWYIYPFYVFQCVFWVASIGMFKKIKVWHCRSYISIYPLVLLKKMLKNKIIFDPRSPFPEEGVTAGKWKKNSLSFKMWKNIEKLALQKSDRTIAITKSFVDHFKAIEEQSRLEIVPNNCDVSRLVFDQTFRSSFRKKHQISEDTVVFCYLGTFGKNWNHPDVYANFILQLRDCSIKHKFLFITQDAKFLYDQFTLRNIDPSHFIIVSAGNAEVAKFLSVADFGLNFMKNFDIRLSIKTVEYLAMGLPAIVNTNVAGAKEIINEYNVGFVIDNIKKVNIEKLGDFVSNKINYVERCRKLAYNYFSTLRVSQKYFDIYKDLKK